MGDYTTYLDKLSADASKNIYSDLGGIGSSLAETTIQHAGKGGDLGESLLYGAILGMLGGGLEQYGQIQAADDLSLANKILLGGSAEGSSLSPDLASKAAAYRDAIAREKRDKYLSKIEDSKISRVEDFLKEKDKIGLIGDKVRAERAAKIEELTGGLGGLSRLERPESAAQSEVAPELEEIAVKVPPEFQKQAMTEVANQKKVDRAVENVLPLVDKAYALSTGLQFTDEVLPSWGQLPNVSENAQSREAVAAQIRAVVMPALKGTPSDTDLKKLIEPYIPNAFDGEESIRTKKELLMNFIRDNSEPTPIIDQYGIRPSSSVSLESSMDSGTSSVTPDTNLANERRQFIAEAKAKNLSKEEARSRWNAYVNSRQSVANISPIPAPPTTQPTQPAVGGAAQPMSLPSPRGAL